MESFLDRLQVWIVPLLPAAIRIVLILTAALLLVRVARHLIRRLVKLADDEDPIVQSEAEKRAETLGRIMGQAVTVLVWSVSSMLVLGQLGLDLGPLLAGAGVAGLAVGFGAQTLVKDLIGGFFILLENQFRVNDVISTAGVSGLVESINMRTTVLRDQEANVHVIPNGSIGVLTNLTRGWSRAVMTIGVAYKEDTDRCFEILKQVGKEMQEDETFGPKLEGAFEYLGVDGFGDSAVNLKFMVRTKPMERWSVLRELNRRVKKAFDANGIEIPFPHLTLYLGDEGSNLPLRVDVVPRAPAAGEIS